MDQLRVEIRRLADKLAADKKPMVGARIAAILRALLDAHPADRK